MARARALLGRARLGDRAARQQRQGNEGTNGIQAMDLVGRKLMDGGAAARALIAGIEATAGTTCGDRAARMELAAARLSAATDWMLAAEGEDRNAGAVPYLRAFALALGADYLVRAAQVEPARAALADFHLRCMLPEVQALCAAACEGAAGLKAVRFAQ